jgi:hypothetical protein
MSQVKELDMGIPRDELIAGMTRLLEKLGANGDVEEDGSVMRFHGPDGITVEVGPMPEDRVRYPILFPRTLVVLRGEGRALDAFYHQFLRAFLRPTG